MYIGDVWENMFMFMSMTSSDASLDILLHCSEGKVLKHFVYG